MVTYLGYTIEKKRCLFLVDTTLKRERMHELHRIVFPCNIRGPPYCREGGPIEFEKKITKTHFPMCSTAWLGFPMSPYNLFFSFLSKTMTNYAGSNESDCVSVSRLTHIHQTMKCLCIENSFTSRKFVREELVEHLKSYSRLIKRNHVSCLVHLQEIKILIRA